MKSRHSETGGDFFMLKKVLADKLWREVRQALPDGAVEGGRVRGDGLLAGKLKPAIYSKTKMAVTRDSLFQGYIFV